MGLNPECGQVFRKHILYYTLLYYTILSVPSAQHICTDGPQGTIQVWDYITYHFLSPTTQPSLAWWSIWNSTWGGFPPYTGRALSFLEHITKMFKQYRKLDLFWVKVGKQKFISAKKSQVWQNKKQLHTLNFVEILKAVCLGPVYIPKSRPIHFQIIEPNLFQHCGTKINADACKGSYQEKESDRKVFGNDLLGWIPNRPQRKVNCAMDIFLLNSYMGRVHWGLRLSIIILFSYGWK